MSVISIFEATPNRVRALTRTIGLLGPTSRDKLFAMTMPSSDQRDQFANLLKATIELGLTAESKGSGVKLAPGISVEEASDPDWFFGYVERQLLFPASDEAKNSRFRYALAWLLTQIAGTEIPWTSEQNLVMNRQLNGDENYELNSDGRFGMLCYWARFLGYATSLKLKKTVVVVPDPTAAIDRMLARLFLERERLPIGQFLEGVAKLTPVLESGPIRTEVEKRFINPRLDRQLSTATTLALARLERRGRLKLSRRDDAREIWTTSRIVVDGETSTVDRYSHLERG